ncbi:hypothetical protein KAH81_08590, partial [bacterium]|nr:hypothetical protein [bacterium]
DSFYFDGAWRTTWPAVVETDPLSVHLTGNQSIAGEKTFTDPMEIDGANLNIYPVDFDEAIWIESSPGSLPTTTTWLVNAAYSDPGLIALGEGRLDGGLGTFDPSAGYAATYGIVRNGGGTPHLVGGLGVVTTLFKAAVSGVSTDGLNYAGYFMGDVHITGELTIDTIQSPLDTLYIPEKVWVEELVTDTIESRGEFVFIKDAFGVRDSFYFDGAWRTAWPAGGGADADWTISTAIGDGTNDTTLVMGGKWGLFRDGNTGYGDACSTHVNLGVACTTGKSGYDYKFCTVSGGQYNTVTNDYATVGGGFTNAATGTTATVGGGIDNTANGRYATISGGYSNTAAGGDAAIGGGYQNAASNWYTTVSGGYKNNASSSAATVGGGYDNSASNTNATVSGGKENTASGINSAIGGGYRNEASGYYSTIPGGLADTVSGDWSFAFGNNVTVVDNYTAVFFNSGNPGEIGINNETPTSALDVNGDIEVGATDAFYFGDPTTDGTWRIIRVGTDLQFQLRVGGAWVNKMGITP